MKKLISILILLATFNTLAAPPIIRTRSSTNSLVGNFFRVQSVYDGDVYGQTLIGGHVDNYMGADCPGSVILGGVTNAAGKGDYTNAVLSRFSTIAGGVRNRIEGNGSELCFIGSGEQGFIGEASPGSAIITGEGNRIFDIADHSTIAGGHYNSISQGTSYAFLGGGFQNTNASTFGFLGNGEQNLIASSSWAFLGGGAWNVVSANYASLLGGHSNLVSAIGATGIGNRVTNSTPYSVAIGYHTNAMTVASNGTVNVKAITSGAEISAVPTGGGSVTICNNSSTGVSITPGQATFNGDVAVGSGVNVFSADGSFDFGGLISGDTGGNLTVATSIKIGTPTITSGTGAPSASEPNGSIYLRTDGGASTTLYIRHTGTWLAK